jgi:phosphoglycolate phosphatase
MKKLVIFDLDGTLLNTIADLANATNQALEALHFPTHPTEEYVGMVGNGINKLFERALPEGQKSEENVLAVRAKFVPYYNIHNADFSAPYAGTVELLERIQERGVKIAVASNKYQEATMRLVPHYFPTNSFISVLGNRDGVAPKPDPTLVYDIMREAGVEKDEVLYVGDSEVDMNTAINAGVEACAVTWGFCARERLAAYNPKHMVDAAEQILPLVE